MVKHIIHQVDDVQLLSEASARLGHFPEQVLRYDFASVVWSRIVEYPAFTWK